MNEVDALVDTFVEPEGGIQQKLLKIRTVMAKLAAMVPKCSTLVSELTRITSATAASQKLAEHVARLRDTKIKSAHTKIMDFFKRPEVVSEEAYTKRRKDAKDFWSQRPELYTD
eukprot:1756957-Rhodomonas_salina.1